MATRSSYKTVIPIVAAILTLFLFASRSKSLPPASSYLSSAGGLNPWASRQYRGAIPNTVHYTQLLKADAPDFNLKFENWLSAYAAYLYYKPDAIYIHTDATDELISRATALPAPGEPDEYKYTRMTLQIPGVTIRKVVAPTHAGNGKSIGRIQHVSDFVRMGAIYELGGMYMDWDVHPLRDNKPLREAGFANVVGRERNGGVNNGCWMSHKGTALVEIWIRAANEVFDRRWSTHSCKLLHRIADRLVPVPNEVLIMDQKAFAPGSWVESDIQKLFENQNGTEPWDGSRPIEEEVEESDPYQLWDGAGTMEPWEIDYSSSYTIHAFRTHLSPDAAFQMPEVTLDYVLLRQSNFARAVFPVVQQALDSGVLSLE